MPDGVAADAPVDAPAEAALDARADARDVPDAVAAEGGGRDAAVDAAIDYGMCGMAVRACLCGCGTNATCQSNCIFGDEACGGCMYDAAAMCCPAESMAFESCLERFMCADDACAADNCGAEQDAFNRCFARAQAADPSCQTRIRTCLGSDYPMVRCAGGM
jgi:hypothetical protein